MKNNNLEEKYLITNEILFQTFTKDFLPAAFTATALAPLNRIKILLQTMPLIAINEREKIYKPTTLMSNLIREQGVFSLWRGNLSLLYKHFMISYSNILIYKKIEDKLIERNRGIENNSKTPTLFKQFLAFLLSSSISLIFSYPFDLVNTRMSADMTRYGHKKIYSSSLETLAKTIEEDTISRNRLISNFAITRIYKGFGVGLVSNIIYWQITLTSFVYLDKIFKSKIKTSSDDFQYYYFVKKMFIIFGANTCSSILASIMTYPLDTFKRHLQVNESLGFNSDYSKEGVINGFKKFFKSGNVYRGFSVNVLKMIPQSFIHYCLYSYIISSKI